MEIRNFEGHQSAIKQVGFINHNKEIISLDSRGKFIHWDLFTGNMKPTFKNFDEDYTNDDAFEIIQDSNHLIAANSSSYSSLHILKISKKTSFAESISDADYIANYIQGKSDCTDIKFSKAANCIVSSYENRTLNIWDLDSDKKINTLIGHSGVVNCLEITPDGKFVISGSENAEVIIWDIETGKELIKLIFLEKLHSYPAEPGWACDGAFITPNGLFDASQGAMKNMHYSAGLEIIELDQLKERYYEPGLLKKILSGNSSELRNVRSFNSVDLFPDVEVSETDDSRLNISLKNQGGGIGKVSVFINGKEVVADARQQGFDQQAKSATITTEIEDHPYLTPGENKIEVRAYNSEGYLASKNVGVLYDPGIEGEKGPQNLYVIASGVSDYTGDEIDLRFAAKDAVDISNALEIGAYRLFGTDKTFLYELSTDDENKDNWPTKENIIKAFNDIASKAKSTDVFVVYLSGHGINWGGQDGDFYYLTQDAYTASADAYNDPAIRNACTISSDTLVEWFKKVPALKQVLIIDACASGQLVENLQQDRNIGSSTVRALERMKDRTGMHIITGCAADAVSYEATRYGQGVLTYSILEGMQGVALREGRFADVNMLFQHARESVPQLAKGVGGIQKPEIFSPYGAESFDIGLYTTEDKGKIALAKIKPLFIRSIFMDEDNLNDALKLGKIVDEELSEISGRGKETKFIFWDVSEFPDACQLSGAYRQADGTITLRMKILINNNSNVIELSANSKAELKEQIIRAIEEKL